jgi:hypothetical protein
LNDEETALGIKNNEHWMPYVEHFLAYHITDVVNIGRKRIARFHRMLKFWYTLITSADGRLKRMGTIFGTV